jgi:hypothetical protein
MTKAAKSYLNEMQHPRVSYKPIQDLSFNIGSGGISSKEASEILQNAFANFNAEDVHKRLDLMTLEFNSQLNKLKQITMHEKLIKQIKELPGVKKIEPFDKRFIITFDPVKQAVECENVEQLNFTRAQKDHKAPVKMTTKKAYVPTCKSDTYSFQKGFYGSEYTIIPFTQYLTDYNLTDEWEAYLRKEIKKRYPIGTKVKCLDDGDKFIITDHNHHVYEWITGDRVTRKCKNLGVRVYNNGKWAEIIPDEVELVEGDIYTSKHGDLTWIFRLKSVIDKTTASYHSISDHQKEFHIDCWLCHRDSTRTCTPATPNQESKLIRAEIKNGYLWKDGKLITLKKK